MKAILSRRFALPAIAAITLSGCATYPAADAPVAPVAVADTAPAPLSELIAAVDIPYESFTLPNGLTTIVHTDRKAPIVNVTTYYRVGSKHEPRGRTGFAHLFEHLMFGGSENVENFDIPLEGAGSTPTNGSTWYDRTNYYETVPTGALDLALMMESDRMGHLLGAVSQEKLDNQRMVVQNEKRQGDNAPYALAEYVIPEAIFPVGHPYRHSTIGSMADLEAASLADVRDWFKANYGPNNVVLVLSGDIDAATARAKVERWFGDIPRGPEVPEVVAPPVTLAAPLDDVITDQVPVPRLYKVWIGPGMEHPDAVPLQVAMYILGGLASSRLDNEMVRGQELAVSASAYSMQVEQLSFLQAEVNVKQGVEQAQARALLEQEIARLVADGPTEDELRRAVTQIAASTIGGLQGVMGKSITLAEGELYTENPAQYRADLEAMAALTPARVRDAMQRWLSRPAYNLAVVPGERTLDGAKLGGWGDEHLSPPPAPDAKQPIAAVATGAPRAFPEVAPVGALTFPAVNTATLSNGIEVVLARREAVPQVSLALTLDAGSAVDPKAKAGRHATMIELLPEGTTTRSALDIAVERERLGASISANASTDMDIFVLNALSPNLRPSVELFADIVLNPAFAADAVARVKEQQVAGIRQQLASPSGLANRAFAQTVYGDTHPYAWASAANADVVAALTGAELATEHDRWLRPDLARITAVGDVTMPELVAALEAGFGSWRASGGPAPAKAFNAATPAPAQRLILVDRPNSPSSYLMVGRLLPIKGYVADMEALDLANDVLGGGFLSRLMTDLRETKGWTYGIRSGLPDADDARVRRIATQVQADRTADSIRVILDQMRAFPNTSPVDEVEYQRVTDGAIRGLPNRYETNAQVLSALIANRRFGRDIRYDARLPDIYRGIDEAAINTAASTWLQPDELAIVVVGDASTVRPQLETLGMPIETLSADEL